MYNEPSTDPREHSRLLCACLPVNPLHRSTITITITTRLQHQQATACDSRPRTYELPPKNIAKKYCLENVAHRYGIEAASVASSTAVHLLLCMRSSAGRCHHSCCFTCHAVAEMCSMPAVGVRTHDSLAKRFIPTFSTKPGRTQVLEAFNLS